MIDAEIGAAGNIRAKGNIRDLKDIKFGRKKRSPGWFKKVWVSKVNGIFFFDFSTSEKCCEKPNQENQS